MYKNYHYLGSYQTIICLKKSNALTSGWLFVCKNIDAVV